MIVSGLPMPTGRRDARRKPADPVGNILRILGKIVLTGRGEGSYSVKNIRWRIRLHALPWVSQSHFPLLGEQWESAMSCISTRLMLRISAWIATALLLVPEASADPVLPGQGISFGQVAYLYSGQKEEYSQTGRLDIDVQALRTHFPGIPQGFVNVYTSHGWVVQNLPVLSSSSFTYPVVSTNFRLSGSPGPVGHLDAYIDYSPNPSVTFGPGPFARFDGLQRAGFAATGFGSGSPSRPYPPPLVSVVPFIPFGLFSAVIQPGHPALETADDQCLPASVATSFAYLNGRYSTPLPHPHRPGLGRDGSLVGELESDMGRTFRNRRDGDPLDAEPGLRGKLKYVARHRDLHAAVPFLKHQGLLGDRDISETVDGRTATSRGQGTTVTADFIIRELSNGEDVELGFLYKSGGGHFVEVIGAGTILGIPWIMHMSDHDQTRDDRGTGLVDFSFLLDIDGDGRLNLVNNPHDANLAVVFSQSVPGPSTVLLCLIAAGLAWRRRTRSEVPLHNT